MSGNMARKGSGSVCLKCGRTVAASIDWCPRCDRAQKDEETAVAQDEPRSSSKSNTPKGADVIAELMLPEGADVIADRIRAWMVLADIEKTNDDAQASTKRQWAGRWKQLFLPSVEMSFSKNPEYQFSSTLKDLGEIPTKLQAGILLVELINFTPYVPMTPDEEADDGEKAFNKALKKANLDDELRFDILGRAAMAMGFEKDYPKELHKAFKSALHQLQGGWTKTIAYAAGGAVLLAIAGAASATGIGAAIGAAMGLHGAAAIAAGLAFLGGGSLASGGLGMAGGFAVIVATGGAIGAGAGYGTKGIVQHLTKAAALNESAKVRVVMDEVVRKHHSDVLIHQEVLRRQRALIGELQEQADQHRLELARLKQRQNKDKARMKQLKQRVDELEEIVGAIETAIRMGRETYIEHALEA